MQVLALVREVATRSGVKNGNPWEMTTLFFLDNDDPRGGTIEVDVPKDMVEKALTADGKTAKLSLYYRQNARGEKKFVLHDVLQIAASKAA